MRTLFVFDIDGTLLHSVAPHQAAFLATLRHLGLTGTDPGWGRHTHHTDSWIFREIFRASTGRAPTTAETRHFAEGLAARFRAATGTDGLVEVEGAAGFLHALRESGDHAVAFATGGMREVTEVKLAFLGVNAPVATAEDHTFREHIVREAVHRAGPGFDRVVAVGDGPWDLRAAMATGSGFIGIGPSNAPFGDWFPRTHRFESYTDIDPTADFSLTPPTGAVAAEPDPGGTFTAGPDACACWD